LTTGVLCTTGLISCNSNSQNKQQTAQDIESPFFKLSLAQWSIHKMIKEQGLNPFLFAEKAKNWGFEGLEYVATLYDSFFENYDNSLQGIKAFSDKCNNYASLNEIKNLLIMVDGDGDLAIKNKQLRTENVEKHKKWIDAAHEMGCHAIRINLFGETEIDAWKEASLDSLFALSNYAKELNINILVENHGSLSSDAALLASVIKEVNMANCGTLPDFGNFCIKRENDQRWGGSCMIEYDKYKGVEELMPFAKALSAKSYDFDKNGNETTIDFYKMLTIAKGHQYTGYIGVEFEGTRLSEEEGILATKNLLIVASKNL
jgi:sugar phosphate isomerase/epimerase